MKAPKVSILVGAFGLIFGVWWLYGGFVEPVVRTLLEPRDWSDSFSLVSNFFFLLLILPLISIPAFMATLYGYRLLKNATNTNVKGVVGAFVIAAIFSIQALIPPSMPPRIDDIWTVAGTFVLGLLFLPVYVQISKFLIRRIGLTPVKGEFIGKGICLIFALKLWIVCGAILEAHYSNILAGPWGVLGAFAPALVAWLFYRVSTRIAASSLSDQNTNSSPMTEARPSHP